MSVTFRIGLDDVKRRAYPTYHRLRKQRQINRNALRSRRGRGWVYPPFRLLYQLIRPTRLGERRLNDTSC